MKIERTMSRIQFLKTMRMTPKLWVLKDVIGVGWEGRLHHTWLSIGFSGECKPWVKTPSPHPTGSILALFTQLLDSASACTSLMCSLSLFSRGKGNDEETKLRPPTEWAWSMLGKHSHLNSTKEWRKLA